MTQNVNLALKNVALVDQALDVNILAEKGQIFKKQAQHTRLLLCLKNKKWSGYLYCMWVAVTGIIVLLFCFCF